MSKELALFFFIVTLLSVGCPQLQERKNHTHENKTHDKKALFVVLNGTTESNTANYESSAKASGEKPVAISQCAVSYEVSAYKLQR